MPFYRTGLLIIRAWVEKGSRKPLRANLRATTDVSHGPSSEITVTDSDAVTERVETWLSEVQDAAEAEPNAAKPSNGEKK